MITDTSHANSTFSKIPSFGNPLLYIADHTGSVQSEQEPNIDSFNFELLISRSFVGSEKENLQEPDIFPTESFIHYEKVFVSLPAVVSRSSLH